MCSFSKKIASPIYVFWRASHCSWPGKDKTREWRIIWERFTSGRKEESWWKVWVMYDTKHDITIMHDMMEQTTTTVWTDYNSRKTLSIFLLLIMNNYSARYFSMCYLSKSWCKAGVTLHAKLELGIDLWKWEYTWYIASREILCWPQRHTAEPSFFTSSFFKKYQSLSVF